MSWQILLFISVVLVSFGVLLQRILMKEEGSDPWAYSIVFQLLVGTLAAIYGFLFSEMAFPRDVKFLIPNIILMILLYSANNVFLYSALKKIEASIFTIIISTRSLFTVFASSVFLNELLTGKQFIGALFILSGAVFVNLNKKSNLKFEKGIIYAFLAASAFGFANTNDRILLQHFNLYPYITIGFILPASFMLMIKPSSFRKIKDFTNIRLLRKMVILCLVFTASSATFFRALQIAPNSSQVTTIMVSSVVLTVFLSIIFLKERENVGRKIIGALAAFLGLLLVS